MSDSWDERRRAQEDGYFDALNKQALARLAAKQGKPALKSPASGNPLEPITVMGIVVDRCVDSGGVWFDSGELALLLETIKSNPAALKDATRLIVTPKSGQALSVTHNSPISGKPMARHSTLGVTVYQCAESGGMWIEALEFKRLVESSLQTLTDEMKDFFSLVAGKK